MDVFAASLDNESKCVVIVLFTNELNCEDLDDSTVLMVTTFSFGNKLNLRDDDEITC